MTALPCLILAGGRGTRIQPVIGETPKCLAPIGDTTFLSLQLRALRASGISKLFLSLGSHATAVVEWLRASPEFNDVSYIIETSPLGTGGAIAFAFRQLAVDALLVTNGDTLIEADISSMFVPLSASTGELARMAVVHRSDRRRYGGVVTDDSSRITGFVEKGSPTPGLVNSGMYLFSTVCFQGEAMTQFSLEQHTLPTLSSSGALFACSLQGTFTDIGVPEDYFAFCEKHAKRKSS